jgi:hypothetical protein
VSSSYRRDTRTQEEFEHAIKRASDIEQWLMRDVWIPELRSRKYDISAEDNGCDNSGAFQTRVNSKPDFKVTLDGLDGLIEIKTNPHFAKCTWKVESLKAYLQHNATILLFFNIATKSDKFKLDTNLADVKWTLIVPSIIERWLSIYDHKIYYGYNGNKLSIQFPKQDYPGWFKVYGLTEFGGVDD